MRWSIIIRDFEANQKQTQSCIIRFKQYMSHAIFCLFNKLKRTFASIEFKTNGPALLFKTIFRPWYSLLSSVALDCKGGHGLKREKIGAMLSSFKMLHLWKSPKNVLFNASWWNLFDILVITLQELCVWVMASWLKQPNREMASLYR